MKQLRIGCGEWGFRELPMRRHFEIAQRFGFRWLEFGIGGGKTGRLSEQPDAAEIDAFKAMAGEFGIECPFCCIENDFTLADADAHAAMVAKAQRQIRAAAECGATHVRLFAGFTPAEDVSDEIYARCIAAFEVCDHRCEELGLVIAIETHGGIEFNADGSAIHINSLTTDRDRLADLVRDLPPRVGFNFDPGNIKAVVPVDTRYCLDVINERVNYCHLKDWTRKGEGWVAVAIGDDDLEYAPLFRELLFDGVCLIEYEPLEDTEEGIQRSLDYLKSLDGGEAGLEFRLE